MDRLTEYDYLAGVKTGDLKAGIDERKAFDRLAAYEDTGLEPEDIISGLELAEVYSAIRLLKQYEALGTIDDLTALVKARDEGRFAVLPLVAMVEKSLQGGHMRPERDQRFNGRYAVVYSGKGKWGCPLIDICGTPYNSGQAEERKNELARAEAEAELKGAVAHE